MEKTKLGLPVKIFLVFVICLAFVNTTAFVIALLGTMIYETNEVVRKNIKLVMIVVIIAALLTAFRTVLNNIVGLVAPDAVDYYSVMGKIYGFIGLVENIAYCALIAKAYFAPNTDIVVSAKPAVATVQAPVAQAPVVTPAPTATAAPAAANCPHCGAPLAAGAAFCVTCGKKVN